jgi:hypothetical protein
MMAVGPVINHMHVLEMQVITIGVAARCTHQTTDRKHHGPRCANQQPDEQTNVKNTADPGSASEISAQNTIVPGTAPHIMTWNSDITAIVCVSV